MIDLSVPPPAICQPAPQGQLIHAPHGSTIFLRTIGRGRPLLVIPSLGRSVRDFEPLARSLARKGTMTILAEVRGIAPSSGPVALNLQEFARDAETVLAARCAGPVDVVGHAFGNRVARMLATIAPSRVRSVVLLAGGGEVPLTTEMGKAIALAVHQGAKPDAKRLRALELAFFAKGQDASVWLRGWFPRAAEAQVAANRRTPIGEWWLGGSAPVLLVQATEDPIAPPANADALLRDAGDRATVVELRHASHAMLPERPIGIARLITAWLRGRTPSGRSGQDQSINRKT